jgi:hypothetical protein
MDYYGPPRLNVPLTVILVSLAILVIAWPRNSREPQFSSWRPAGPSSGLSGSAQQTFPMNLQVAAGLYSGQEAQLANELALALNYASIRVEAPPSGPIEAIVTGDGACGFHGLADTSARIVYVYSCAGIARQRVVNIMAHEFVHQLAHDRYGSAHLNADLILMEGFATWGAGDYWLSGRGSFRNFVREQGVHYPLATHYNSVGAGGMDILYYQWASFVEYLIELYGRDAFDRLYVSGAKSPGSADYRAIYGKSLDQLEQEWRVWLGL